MTNPDNAPEFGITTVELSVAGRRVKLEVPAPIAPVRTVQLLPIFQTLADAFVDMSVKSAEEKGAKISCRKGCGACCRQLVPISVPEARRIRALVDQMPEPRRSNVLARFEAARTSLEEAGLLDRLMEPQNVSDDQANPLGLEYFSKGIPCPFLEAESCSIHADRPIPCREYLVTTPAENCARPTAETVSCVNVALKASKALLRMSATPGQGSHNWVPLILALSWAQAHPEDDAPRPGTEILHDFFVHLTGKRLPEADI